MRKANREMSEEWALDIFDKAPYITVSMVDTKDSMPYAVPLSLARIGKDFYFHCALEGKKNDILKVNANVCLIAVTKCKPLVSPNNAFTLEFKSATAFGVVEFLEDRDEKIVGLKAICERFLPHHMHSFEQAIERSLDRTAVYRIRLTQKATGKRKQYGKDGKELEYGKME